MEVPYVPEATKQSIEAAETGRLTVRAEAAVGLAARDRSGHPLHAGELELLHDFAASSDERIREAVVQAVFALAATDLPDATDLLTRVRFSNSRIVADRIFMSLTWNGNSLAWPGLTSAHNSKRHCWISSLTFLTSGTTR